MQEHGVLVRILAIIHTINTKDPKEKKTPLSGSLCSLGDHQITGDFNHLGLVKTQDFHLQVRTLNKGSSVNAIFSLNLGLVYLYHFLKLGCPSKVENNLMGFCVWFP